MTTPATEAAQLNTDEIIIFTGHALQNVLFRVFSKWVPARGRVLVLELTCPGVPGEDGIAPLERLCIPLGGIPAVALALKSALQHCGVQIAVPATPATPAAPEAP